MRQETEVLLCLDIDEIQAGNPTKAHVFLIKGAAQSIAKAGGKNWIPIIVKQTGAEEYQVIANSFVFAAAKEAGLQQVFCIIADDSEQTQESAQILAQEAQSKINLATATRDEIKAGLDYLISRSSNPLVGVKLPIATERISSAPRETWKENLMDVTKLKCGITKGKKLDILKEVFYITPSVIVKPDPIIDPSKLTIAQLKKMTVPQLKALAKEKVVKGYTKMKKAELVAELVKVLS